MPFLRPAVGVLTTLRAQSGALVRRIPRDDLLVCETPDAVDLTGTGTLVVRASSPAAVALTAGCVIEIVDWASVGVVAAVEEWRVLARRIVGGVEAESDAGVITYTLTHPILEWADAGQCVGYSSGGIPSWDLSGVYTPGDVLAIALAQLAAHGQGYWIAGTIDRTDAKSLKIQNLDPAQVRALIQSNWNLEASPRRVDASTWALDLLTKRGSDAAVPTLRATGPLRRVDWTQDATPLATAVLPRGANGATIAYVAWTVAGVAGSVVSLVDPKGGPGPVARDHWFEGAYLQKPDGTRTPVTATARNDGATSLVTVADATGLTAGDATTPPDVVEFRADAAGTRLVVLQDAAAVAASRYREVPLDRSDLGAARNYAPNARGGQYASTSAAPAGYTMHGTVARLAPGVGPAGCPIGDDALWQITPTTAILSAVLPVLETPATPAIDAVAGDALGSSLLVCYIGGALNPQVWTGTRTVVGTDQYGGTPVDAPFTGFGASFAYALERYDAGTSAWVVVAEGQTWSGNTWLQLKVEDGALTGTAPYRLRGFWIAGSAVLADPAHPENALTNSGVALTVDDVTAYPVTIAGALIARTGTLPAWLEGSEGTVLHDAAAVYLLQHLAPQDTLPATIADYAIENPARFGDVPLVVGGDAQLEAPAIGLSRRVRILAKRRNRLAPTPPTLDLAAAPDPAIAALVAYAAPTRKRDIIDILRDEIASASAGSSASASSSGGSTPYLLTPSKTLDAYDPRRFGAVSSFGTADHTSAVANAILAASQDAIDRDPFPAEKGLAWLPDCDAGYVDGSTATTGLYVLDNFQLVAGHRVVMPDGIYVAAAGAWTRVTVPSAFDAVRILNGEVNEGRRLFWGNFGGGWGSWSMDDAANLVPIYRPYRITSPIAFRAGTYASGRGGRIIRDIGSIGGAWDLPAIRFLTQSSNDWLSVRCVDGGSGVDVLHWSGGFYAQMGTLIVRDAYDNVPRDGSVGVRVLRYSTRWTACDTLRFARGIHLNGSDMVVAERFNALSPRDMGIYVGGTNLFHLKLHCDSPGSSKGTTARTAIGIGLGLLEDASLEITGSVTPDQGLYLVACLDGTDIEATNRNPDGTRQYFAWLDHTETVSGVVARIQPIGALNPAAYLRLHNVGNSEFRLQAPQRRFDFGATWDATNHRWSTEARAPDVLVQEDDVGENVHVYVQKNAAAPTTSSGPTSGWPGATYHVV